MGFIGRHPGITMRSLESTSITSVGGFNRTHLTRFCTLLPELQPSDIAVYGSYNCF
jgi:hypothetical protein